MMLMFRNRRFTTCALIMFAGYATAQQSSVGPELSDIQREITRDSAHESPAIATDPHVDLVDGLETEAPPPGIVQGDRDKSDHVSMDDGKVAFTGDWAVLVEERLFSDLRKLLIEAQGDENRIRAALATYQDRLIKRGYMLAQLRLASSEIIDQIPRVKVEVDVGRFGYLSFWRVEQTKEGVPIREPYRGCHFSERQLRRRLADISSDSPFNYAEFYRRLYDINMHPDLTLHTRLRLREDDRRYVDMEMTVEERLPMHAILEISNTGTESTDEWRAGLTLQHLNLFKRDDVLTFRGINAIDLSSLNSFALNYRLPYSWGKGGTVTAFGGYSSVDSDEIAQNISIRGSGWFVGGQGAHRVFDSTRHLVSLGMGLVYRSVEDQLVFADTRGRKRVAESEPLSLSVSYASKREDALRGRNYLTLESVYNIGAGLGVSSDEAFNDLRQNAREEYSLFRLQLARLQSLYFGTELARAKDWSLFIKVEGQYAGEALIPAEQFAVGGMNTVRGYEERALLGDHGGLATMEIRSPLLQNLLARPFSRRKRDSDNRAMDRLQILAFADAGFITRAELLQGEERSETLTSSGLGLRWSWSRYAQLRADVGYRFDETFTQDKGVGFHVSAQLQY